MKSSIAVLVALIIFTSMGCASTPVRQAGGKTYTSDIPPLEIEFACYIRQNYDRGRDKRIVFKDKDVKPIWVEIDYITFRINQVDHFYSLEQIASSRDYCFFGEAYFDGHRWIKIAKENGKGYLMCGYMTRKDHWIIFIHNYTPLTSSELNSYREYQRTLKLSPADEKLIAMMFANLDKTIVSIQ